MTNLFYIHSKIVINLLILKYYMEKLLDPKVRPEFEKLSAPCVHDSFKCRAEAGPPEEKIEARARPEPGPNHHYLSKNSIP